MLHELYAHRTDEGHRGRVQELFEGLEILARRDVVLTSLMGDQVDRLEAGDSRAPELHG
jgi:hypothetical protein